MNHAPVQLGPRELREVYAEPFAATFPPWYDASYWYEGATLHFDLRQQLQAVARGLGNYFRILSLEKEWIAGWLALAIFAGAWREIAKRFFNLWFLWFPSLVALMLYALVLIEPRYVAVAMAILWIALFAALPCPTAALISSRGMVALPALLHAAKSSCLPEKRWGPLPRFTSSLACSRASFSSARSSEAGSRRAPHHGYGGAPRTPVS